MTHEPLLNRAILAVISVITDKRETDDQCCFLRLLNQYTGQKLSITNEKHAPHLQQATMLIEVLLNEVLERG